MSNTRYAKIMGNGLHRSGGARCLWPKAAPESVPNVESVDESTGRHLDLPSPDELELCFRRVPIPRC
jgi:hypothetical protein